MTNFSGNNVASKINRQDFVHNFLLKNSAKYGLDPDTDLGLDPDPDLEPEPLFWSYFDPKPCDIASSYLRYTLHGGFFKFWP
jgi:hypothetical protein